ncbi:MAG: hypothetical protein ACRDI2_07675, partial [Chloroflexota bacterium]
MAATTVANRATVAATTGPALSRAGTGTTATPAWTPAAAVPGSADPTNAAGPGATPEEDPLAEMSGLDRVAALLVTLGPEASAAVLKHFPER